MGVRGNQTTETGQGLCSFYLPSAVTSFCKAHYIDLNGVEDKQKSMSCDCTVNAHRHVVPLKSIFMVCVQFIRELTAHKKLDSPKPFTVLH